MKTPAERSEPPPAGGIARLNVREKLEHLFRVAKGHKRALILTHDNPDPDSLASAVALAHLLELRTPVEASVGYGGIIGRAENMAFVKVLKLPVSPISQIVFSEYDLIALVDTQPSVGNHSLPKALQADIVIDHHPLRDESLKSPYADVGGDFGATSTMLAEYLRAARIEPDPELATALFYGIKADTRDLGRQTTSADIDCYLWLFPRMDKHMLGQIEHPDLPARYFQLYHKAWERAKVYGTAILTDLGEVYSPDMVAEVAERMMFLEGMKWSLAVGSYRSQLYFSLRTRDRRMNAGRLIREVCENRSGSSGGHGSMAGARIPLWGTRAQRSALKREVVKDFLERFGVKRERPVPLLTYAESVIYLDWNATAPLRPEVAELLARSLSASMEVPGNPSSVHQGGRAARARMESARQKVARVLGCEPKEVCFTASGSEADALALRGAFEGRKDRSKNRVVLSAIEHPALLGAARQLESTGAEVVRVAPGPDGRVRTEEFLEALTPRTAIASLMWANNETGVLQPAAEVARACRQRGIAFHTDAVQGAGRVPVTLREVDADLLTLSGHKLGAPTGIGVLVIRRGVEVAALIPGHQEWGRRGGTQNLPFIEAMALALELAHAELDPETSRIAALRDRFEREVRARVEGVEVNAGAAPRLPNTSNLRFAGADGEALLIALDLAGICASSGAACASGSLSPSHVLTAMGLTPKQARESLRFSFGRLTTDAQVDAAVAALVESVPRCRS